jgi:hypothetical protein
VVRARSLHLLLKIPGVPAGVGPAYLLLASTVSSSDELDVATLAVLLIPHAPLLAGLILPLRVGPAIILIEFGLDGLLARGVALVIIVTATPPPTILPGTRVGKHCLLALMALGIDDVAGVDIAPRRLRTRGTAQL